MLRPSDMHTSAAALVVALSAFAAADEPRTQSVGQGVPEPQVWQVGLEITGGDGPASGIVATAPIPDTWPEQQVKVIKQEKTRNVRRITYRDLRGARQMIVSIPRLAAGASAKALITFEITRTFAETPLGADDFKLETRPNRDLQAFLKPSPLIESEDDQILKLAQEITADKATAWQQVQAIFQWVRENVDYREGELKGALAALRDGNGDCEEFASLIIALCRASGIPARTVWVPDHCYCEFYLQDAKGKGHWIACDGTRTYPFGSVYDPRVILQKGDNFYNSAQRKWMRYAAPTLKASNIRGTTGPAIRYIRRPVN